MDCQNINEGMVYILRSVWFMPHLTVSYFPRMFYRNLKNRSIHKFDPRKPTNVSVMLLFWEGIGSWKLLLSLWWSFFCTMNFFLCVMTTRVASKYQMHGSWLIKWNVISPCIQLESHHRIFLHLDVYLIHIVRCQLRHGRVYSNVQGLLIQRYSIFIIIIEFWPFRRDTF